MNMRDAEDVLTPQSCTVVRRDTPHPKYPWFYMDSINHRENATSIGWFGWMLQVQEQAEKECGQLAFDFPTTMGKGRYAVGGRLKGLGRSPIATITCGKVLGLHMPGNGGGHVFATRSTPGWRF